VKTRALIPATADLFAAADVGAADVGAADATRLPAPAPLPQLAVPPPGSAARSCSKHLWYAVVFPQLPPKDSAAALERLCMHARQFTSRVSLEMPNALLLEIKGSVKLFGSLGKLHAAIDGAWSRLTLAARSATAPSTLAALWFARAGEQVIIEEPHRLAGALAKLPLACTSWDAERLHTLRAMGVTRVGELLRLPRAGMARRFGPAVPLELDIALARQAAPRRNFVPRERFRERCGFETEIETVAYLSRAIEPLIERCARFLHKRQAGVQALELRLRHRARADTRVRLGLASITSAPSRLQEVLAQKLSRLELAAPVRGMELLSGSLQPLAAASHEVFAPGGLAGGRDTAPQLVERLRARLGEGAVYGIRAVPEHRPEAAWRRLDELPLHALRVGARTTPRNMTATGAARPVWLLQEPIMLFASEVQRLQQSDVILEQGPERIESGWWDGKDIARDYYRARQTGGARLWVFQERRSECWYVHGVFA